jgi:uncharacterized repeat protein (TIGR02543 family)
MAYSPGTAVVTARSADGGPASATVNVTVTHGNKYLRNLIAPKEAITASSALLLWNRDEGTQIPDHTFVNIYVDGKYAGNSLRSTNNAKDVLAIAKAGADTGTYGNKMGYRVEGLSPSTQYELRADAFNTAGDVVASESVTVTTRPAPAAVLDVTAEPYNAAGDGVVTDTYAIQRAINDCPAGGEVVLPEGRVFLSGSVFLKSDMTFRVEGILLGSINPKDYPKVSTRWEGWRKVDRGYLENNASVPNTRAHASLVVAGAYDEGENTLIGPFNVGNFAIVGKGQINANGYRLGYHEGMNGKAPRPDPLPPQADATVRGRAVTFHNAQGVYVADVDIAYSPSWSMHAIYSDSVTFDGLDLISKNPNKTTTSSRTADGNTILNGDGVNPDSSSNVNVYDVYFCTGDDCVTLKSGRNGQGWRLNKPTKYVRVTDSSSIGSKGGFAMGSEIAGGVNNVLFQNLYVEDISLDAIWIKTRWSRGGVIENISFRDARSTGTGSSAVLISISYSSSDNNPAGEKTGDATGVNVPPLIRNLTFENIVTFGTSGSNNFVFQGINSGSSTVDGVRWTWPASRIQNVVMRNSSSSRSTSSLNYVDGFTAYNVSVSGNWGNNNSLNVVLNAAEHTVAFDSNGGSAVQSQRVPHGGTLPELLTPEKEGQIFGGWHRDASLAGSPWDMETDTVSEDVTLYAKWTDREGLRDAWLRLDRALEAASAYVNPSPYTAESWAAFAGALAAAAAAADASPEAVSAAAAALEAAVAGLELASPPAPSEAFPVAEASFAGPAAAVKGFPAEYTLSMANVRNLGTVMLQLAYDSSLLTLDSVSALNGFSLLSNQGGLIVIWNAGGMTSAEAKDVLRLRFTAAAAGAADVEIKGLEAASYLQDGSGAADVAVSPPDPAKLTTAVSNPDDYDFNKDGQVTLADLATAQLYYRAAAGDANWDVAAAADVDGNGVVTVADFILILRHIEGRS